MKKSLLALVCCSVVALPALAADKTNDKANATLDWKVDAVKQSTTNNGLEFTATESPGFGLGQQESFVKFKLVVKEASAGATNFKLDAKLNSDLPYLGTGANKPNILLGVYAGDGATAAKLTASTDTTLYDSNGSVDLFNWASQLGTADAVNETGVFGSFALKMDKFYSDDSRATEISYNQLPDGTYTGRVKVDLAALWTFPTTK